MLLSNRLRNGLAAVVATTLLAGAAQAASIGIIGDDTTLEPAFGANVLIDASVALTPTGTGSLDALGEVILPITSGLFDFDFLEGNLEHAGSGFVLSRGSDAVVYENLSVDLTNLEVFADVTPIVGGVPDVTLFGDLVFDITLCSFTAGFDRCKELDGSTRIGDWGLRFTFTAADDLGTTLGLTAGQVDALTEQHVFLAEFDLREVPEPGTALLIGAGLAGLTVAGRRRV